MNTKRPNWSDCHSWNVTPQTLITPGDSVKAFIGDVTVNLILLTAMPENDFTAKIIFFEPSNLPTPENLKTGEEVIINRNNICWR